MTYNCDLNDSPTMPITGRCGPLDSINSIFTNNATSNINANNQPKPFDVLEMNLAFDNPQQQPPLTLSEKLRRRQFAIQQQQPQQDIPIEAQMSALSLTHRDIQALPLSSTASSTLPPLPFDVLPGDFEYPQTMKESATVVGCCGNSETATGLNFSVDELIMDEEQRFHFTSTSPFI